MPRFIGTADIHIHLRKDVPKDWQMSRYRQFFAQLITECETRQANLLVAGDTLHSVEPTPEELELFLNLLHDLNDAGISVYLVSGNHETIGKGESVLDRLAVRRFSNVLYRPTFNFNTQGVTLHLVNHDSIAEGPPKPEPNSFNLLVSHFRCNVNQFIREEIDVAEFCKPFDLCVVGDIHDSLNWGNVWYANNPVNDQFEPTPNCSFLYIDIDPDKKTYKVERIKSHAPSLVQVRTTVDEYDPSLFNDRDFYRVEVTGPPSDLRALKTPARNVKLDKVPLTEQVLATDDQIATLKEVDTITGSVEEEFMHYMQVIGYSEHKIASMMDIFREHAV